MNLWILGKRIAVELQFDKDVFGVGFHSDNPTRTLLASVGPFHLIVEIGE